MSGAHMCSVDIGGTKITVSIFHEAGIQYRAYQRTVLHGPDTAVPTQVLEIIEHCMEHVGIEGPLSVGVSTAGPFRKVDGMVTLVSPNMCGSIAKERGLIPNVWRSIPLEAELRKSISYLRIGNDAVTGAIAERNFGAGSRKDDLIYVTWSTGIGTGAFVDGNLIGGKNGNAPHAGHMYLVDDGPQCGCGNFGDLESLASGVAIARDYGGTTVEAFEAYRRGDNKAKEVIYGAARYFARGLASLNAVFDTSLIIIGGSVFQNNHDVLLPLIKEEFYNSFPVLSKGVDIRPSLLGNHLGELAGASLVMSDEWVEKWKITRPWEDAPKVVLLD